MVMNQQMEWTTWGQPPRPGGRGVKIAVIATVLVAFAVVAVGVLALFVGDASAAGGCGGG